MTTFSLLIKSSPYATANHQAALDFATTLLTEGHMLRRVFLYQDAVFAALSTQQPVQGQISITQQWQSLAADAGIRIQVCIANALRRGVTDITEQQRYNLPAATLAPGFELAGLGEMAEACADSDRVIEF
ncbi:MAG: sulfurtransferase complex subunit TusD [Oleibacter sp.]|nr:sulfurtransferase complex subunit TusD [Thalassolituus sp.]|tara:strand:- start:412 stop:801 length:390 start_codon:yes stop_codon:yes gene_type:complete